MMQSEKEIMIRRLFFIAVIGLQLYAGNVAFAQTALPSTPGWYQIPNSALQSVCPANNFSGSGYSFNSYCRNVTEAWSSAVFDTRRNRLIVWGGGHNDYYGNEIYALNLNTLNTQRLTDPGLPIAGSDSPEAIAGGSQPNSRHTYDGIAYMENYDKMFVFGGGLAGVAGVLSAKTWLFDFPTMSWQQMSPSGTIPSAPPGIVTAYDPNRGFVFLHDDAYLYSYDFSANRYQRLSGSNPIDYHMSAVIDPVRKRFVMVGGGSVYSYDISTSSSYARQTLSTTGGSSIVSSSYPGLAYDPTTSTIMAWSGGDTVYSLNLDTRVWTPYSYSGGPGSALGNGTYKRWSYSPTSGVFVVVNAMNANAYAVRLSSSASDSTVPSVPTGLAATAVSSSQINLAWTAATDNVGVAGYRIYRAGSQIASVTSGTSYQDTNLSASTSYSYTVSAYDAAGNASSQSSAAVGTTQVAADATPPAISITAPAAGTVSGQAVAVTASTSDNVGVVGVLFELDGAALGTEDTIAPYAITWNTTATSNGSHTLVAIARDAAGNQTTSSGIAVTVSNLSTDTQAPTVPSNVTATAVSSSLINLSWSASTDNVGVTGYKVFRSGSQIATVTGASYQDTNRAASTSYSYSISAYDAAGNNSGQSGTASATTPSATSAKITSFQLTSAGSGTLPFTVGLGFRRGDISGVPVLGISDSQVIVKTRWSDNSVKHAIASGQISLTGGVSASVDVLAAASSPAGTALTAASIQAANPSASVQLGSIGTVNLSSLLASPFRTWISGPEMVEAHYRSAVGTDSTLRVWFYVRLYKAGRMQIRAVVENGYLDVSTSNKSYVPNVAIGGTTVYNNSGASLTHYAHTRWSAEGWIGGNPQVTPKINTSYLTGTKLVPNYWQRNPSASALNNLYQSYSPMQNGGWTATMGDTGFQSQIGLLPRWDALFLTSSGDARAFNSVLANANALNSYPIVWTDSATKMPPMPSSRPTWTIYGADGGGDTTVGAGSLVWDVAHHGSGAYLAYLITGDYYYLETMENQAALCFLINSSSNGSGTSRILQGQTRAAAWCTRTIGQLAAIGPSDSLVEDYRTLLSNNITHWNSQRQKSGQNLIGYLYSYEIGSYGAGSVSPWQQHFWVQTYGFLSNIDPVPNNLASLNAVRDFLYQSVVGILGTAGTSSYCYTKASAYTLKISDTDSGDSTTWYDSWGTVYQSTIGSANASCGTSLEGSSGGDPANAATGYWGNLLPAIAYAVDHGAPGAAAAWQRLTSSSNWSVIQNSGFSDTPTWGVVPLLAAPTSLRSQ
jgi:chitodextrinase